MKKLVWMVMLLVLISFVSATRLEDNREVITWKVTQHDGIEKNLGVLWEETSPTSTEFCLNVIDRYKLVQDSINNFKDISDIPIKELSNKYITIDKTNLDLSKKSESCFTIRYEKLIENLSIKVGWESLRLDSTAIDLSTAYGYNKLIGVAPNGSIYLLYDDNSYYLKFMHSTDNGVSFNSAVSIINLASHTEANLIIYDNSSVDVCYEYSANFDYECRLSKDAKNFDSSRDYISNSYASLYSFVRDGNDILHGCFTEYDDLWYFNSTGVNKMVEIDSTDSEHCDIDVSLSNDICIAQSNDADDNLYIFCSMDGYTKHTVKDYTNVLAQPYAGVSIDFSSDESNPEIWIALTQNYDLYVCNSTLNSYDSNWDCNQVDSANSYNPHLGISEAGQIYVMYGGNSDNFDVYLANTTDGVNWEVRKQIPPQASSGWGNFADSTFPVENRLNDTMHFIYVSAADVYYMNKSDIYAVAEEEEPPPEGDTCDCSSLQAGTNIDCSENCDFETCSTGAVELHTYGTGILSGSSNLAGYTMFVVNQGCIVT